MENLFSAIPSSIGYLFQIRYALFRLLEAEEEAELSIEWIDDVEIGSGGTSKEQLQLKHHIKQQGSLSDASVDLWKTIRVWAEATKSGELNPAKTRLFLITTGKASDDSIASLLKGDSKRDSKLALRKLMDVAQGSSSDSLKSAFAAFKVLSSPKKQLLVDSITIVDGAPHIGELDRIIKRRLDIATSKDRLDALFERVEGWWFDKAIAHLLNSKKAPIKRFELQAKIRDISEQLEPDALPIDFLDAEPASPPDAENDERTFVVQLRIIMLGQKLIEKAIRDYYRAFEQRSKWARENLLIDEEVTKYEKRLVDEWERFFLSATGDIPTDGVVEAALQKDGRSIFNWMNRTAQIHIKPKVTEPYVMRGSYHMLANEDPPRVGWHPRFLERLQQLLEIPNTQ